MCSVTQNNIRDHFRRVAIEEYEKGNAFNQKKMPKKAIECYLKALSVNPNLVEAHYNLANTLMADYAYQRALTHYQKATSLRPDVSIFHFALGKLYSRLNQSDEAIVSLDKAIALDKENHEAYFQKALVLEAKGLNDSAIELLTEFINEKPNVEKGYHHLGQLYDNQGKLKKATRVYQTAISHLPNSANLRLSLAFLYLKRGKFDESITQFCELLTIEPSNGNALVMYWHLKQCVCDWEAHDTLHDKIKRQYEAQCQGEVASMMVTFPLIAMFDDPELVLNITRQYIQKKITSALSGQVFRDYQITPGKIKIAYVSSDFHDHATSFLMANLFELHDREHFELYGFYLGAENPTSVMQKRVASAFNQFYFVANDSAYEIAKKIHQLGVHIAVDLKGYTQNSRSLIFAHRPAPIQVNFIGYPSTMGADFIDYLIADTYLIPKAYQKDYDEKIVYMPPSYQVNDSKRAVAKLTASRKDYDIDDDAFVFCCFNNAYKITPYMFAVWMRLLKQLPKSVLWLLVPSEAVKERLIIEAKNQGISAAQLRFAEFASMQEHLSRLMLSDLFLDTFPCNAHTTASDSLWAGLPVLSLSGRSFASRVGGSLLKACDLDALIVDSIAAYEEKALYIAHNPSYLTALKEQLSKSRDKFRLFDTHAYCRDLEKAYNIMIDRYKQGLDASHIYLDEEL